MLRRSETTGFFDDSSRADEFTLITEFVNECFDVDEYKKLNRRFSANQQ